MKLMSLNVVERQYPIRDFLNDIEIFVYSSIRGQFDTADTTGD